MNLHRNTLQYKGLSLLVAGLFFFSCKKENSTLQLPGEAELPSNTIYADTFTVNLSSTLVYEDFATSNPSRSGVGYLMVGGYHNEKLPAGEPWLGNTRVNAFARLQLVSEYQDLSDITLDSTYLELDYNYAYGDTNTAQTLSVYKLTSDINTNTSYVNSAEPTYSGLLGSTSFEARPSQGTNAHITIADIPFVNSILSGPKNNADFLNMFKGIAIIPTDTNGAILRVNVSSSETRLVICYHQAGIAKKYQLKLDGTRYYTVHQNRTGTSVSTLQNQYDQVSSATTSNYSYLQSGTGLRTKITFPYLHKFIETQGDVYIHKAELVLPVQGASPPDSTYLVKVGSNDRVSFNSGVAYTIQREGAAVGGFQFPQYGTNSSNAYTFQIRSYLQGLVYGEIGNHGLLLTPTRNTIQFNSGIFNNQSAASNQVKLKIYYTHGK